MLTDREQFVALMMSMMSVAIARTDPRCVSLVIKCIDDVRKVKYPKISLDEMMSMLNDLRNVMSDGMKMMEFAIDSAKDEI